MPLVAYRIEQREVRRHALGPLLAARDYDGVSLHALVIDDDHLGPTTRPKVVEWARGLGRMKAHPRVQHRVDLVDRPPALTVMLRAVEGSPPGRPTMEHVESVLAQVASGLAHAHEAQVFHGALTPSALVCPVEQPVVCDFGAQRLAASLHPTRAGGYDARWLHSLAPEELRGQMPEPSAAADVYALGVLAWEWITGSVPFGHRSGLGAIIQATLQEDVQAPPELDSFLRIPSRMLAKDPSQRPSAAEVATALGLEWPVPVPY